MTIYVVETMYDYCTQMGFSTSKKKAEEKAKELERLIHRKTWVETYTTDKNDWCAFDGD